MKKYQSVFVISLRQEFVYRLNFIMWRVRNMMQIIVFFFLWNAAFSGKGTEIFGYSKEKMFTYAFMLIFVRAITLSSRSVDVAGQIGNGELTNFLLRPINFFKYLITRDLSSKLLNIAFAMVEFGILYIILKPQMFFQTNIFYLLSFLASIAIAMAVYFCIIMLTNCVPFWIPEVAWGAQFLVLVVIVEFLSGSVFPLDVFPQFVYRILLLTPFPYLVFIPIKIYLGAIDMKMVLQSLVIGGLWSFILFKLMSIVWKKGLKVYEAVGR